MVGFVTMAECQWLVVTSGEASHGRGWEDSLGLGWEIAHTRGQKGEAFHSLEQGRQVAHSLGKR